MLRTVLRCVSALQFLIVTGAVAAPMTFLWHNGVVASTPYNAGGFVPSTNRGINNAGVVAGALTDGRSLRTAATWDGTSFTPLQTLSGFNESTGNGLNNHGVVVGESLSGSRQQPVAWSSGSVIDLGLVTGYTGGLATAVNDANQIVGLQFTAVGYDAASWFGGASQILTGLPGAKQTEATAVNSSGTVVGISANTAVVWRNGGAEVLPGCTSNSGAYAINDAGQIAGRCGYDAVVWENGVMTVAGTGLAVGIDDAGTLLIRSNDDPLQSQSYLHSASGTTLLDGFAWSQPFASSGNGYIVGFGDQVPEPATYSICTLGLATFLLCYRLVGQRLCGSHASQRTRT